MNIPKPEQAESEWKIALDELRLRESYLSAIIENLPGLLWMKDREGKFLAVNTQFAASCGLNDPSLLIGKTDFDIWPPNLAAGYVADDEKVILSGKPCMVEEPIAVSGDIQWFETFKTPIRDPRGAIIGTTGYSRNITERKKAADALLASELKYRELANTVPIGIFECDRAGKLIFANPILYTWFGYSETDVLGGINVLELIDASDRERAAKELSLASDLSARQPHEYCAMRKDGSAMQVLIISRPRIVNGEAAGLRGILLDLTEKKRMEAAIQNTTRLESLGVLAGGIAHDFNNLLTGIFGFIDLARMVSRETETREYLESTFAALGRAKALTLQLLTFAKGGAPVQKITPLMPFIQETAQFALSGSNVSCSFFIEENLWQCNIDKNQIGQVIDNIVINAQQAMPNGGTIAIKAENISLEENGHSILPAGDYVKVSIKDTGIGISPEIMPHIFDPFYTTKTKGHGLGLATCYSIITRHGGCIEVESAPARGSTFRVFLPAFPKKAIAFETVTVRRTGSGAVIIVDDEDVVRNSVGEMLAVLGYSVTCKNDGSAAIEFYKKETGTGKHFFAIFLDLTIPGGMGGKEAVAELRKLNGAIPIIAMSGYTDDSVMKDPARFGFTASISKPFTIAEISDLLNSYA